MQLKIATRNKNCRGRPPTGAWGREGPEGFTISDWQFADYGIKESFIDHDPFPMILIPGIYENIGIRKVVTSGMKFVDLKSSDCPGFLRRDGAQAQWDFKLPAIRGLSYGKYKSRPGGRSYILKSATGKSIARDWINQTCSVNMKFKPNGDKQILEAFKAKAIAACIKD